MIDIFNIADSKLVDFWKEHNLSEQDFYCRECGNILIDINELKNVKYCPNAKKFIDRFFNTSTKRHYSENDMSRWCIRGRELSGKIFFRHLCWDCFFKHLPEVEDIPRRARKGKWYKRILNGEHPVPVSSTSPSAYFRLLFDITDEELEVERSKFDTASLESFIKRHGEAGKAKYEEYRNRQAYTCSKEYMMKEKGLSEKEWHAYNKSRSSTLENFISRYGKELGSEKWKQYCDNEAYAGCTLEYFQKTYGLEEGKKYYYSVCHQKAITLSNFIKKYGSEIGKNKYEKLMHRPDRVGYSIISQNLFKEIDNILGDYAADSKWETKNIEQDIEIEIDGIKKFAKPDYILNKKIIEFNGDYWHANPAFYISTDNISYPEGIKLASEIWVKDAKRINALKALGYQILIIWENEYNLDHEKVVNRCINFLKN